MKNHVLKGFLSVILAAMIAAGLAACGSSSDKDASAENVISFEGVSVGDTVCFGSYEQDGDYTNGEEQIEWEVMDELEGALLLVSKYTLSLQPYNSTGEDTTWENSSLRSWLNEDFLNGAFSEEEQEYICTTTVATGTEKTWVSVESENTQDKIFILSRDEVYDFWEDDNARRSRGTSVVDTGYGYWLRCNTINEYARYVDWLGEISYEGEARSSMVYLESGVRPALWVSATADSSATTTMGDISTRYTQVGDTVTFGSNKGSSQEWIVTKIEGDKLMLVSKECLKKSGVYFKMSFDTGSGGTWDVSSLREWLNGEYLTETFTDEEIAQILTTTVVTSGCADTEDKVFILSEDEAEEFFPTAAERATDVATGGNRGWWLRDDNYVDESGLINNSISFDELSVRPAIWIQNEDYLIYINAYTYKAVKTGSDIDVNDNSDAEDSLDAEPIFLEGCVYDEDRNPLSGVQVSADLFSDEDIRSEAVRTDSDGFYQIEVYGVNEYILNYSLDGYIPVENNFTVTDDIISSAQNGNSVELENVVLERDAEDVEFVNELRLEIASSRLESADRQKTALSRLMSLDSAAFSKLELSDVYSANWNFEGANCIAELPSDNIRMYGYYDDEVYFTGVAFDIDGEICYFDWCYTSGTRWSFRLYWNEKTQQLQVTCPVYYGTGLYAPDLYIVQKDENGTWVSYRFGYEEYSKALENRLTCVADAANEFVTIIDRQTGEAIASDVAAGSLLSMVDPDQFYYGNVSSFDLGETIVYTCEWISDYNGAFGLDAPNLQFELILNTDENGDLSFELGAVKAVY